MRTLTIYLNSFFSGIFKAVIFIASLYLSSVFFLISLFEETLFGKVSDSRKAFMAELIQKLSNIAEPASGEESRTKTNEQSLLKS
jgi:hypothetical protein